MNHTPYRNDYSSYGALVVPTETIPYRLRKLMLDLEAVFEKSPDFESVFNDRPIFLQEIPSQLEAFTGSTERGTRFLTILSVVNWMLDALMPDMALGTWCGNDGGTKEVVLLDRRVLRAMPEKKAVSSSTPSLLN